MVDSKNMEKIFLFSKIFGAKLASIVDYGIASDGLDCMGARLRNIGALSE